MYRLDPHAPGDAAWDTFVSGHPYGHLLQSSGWGRFRSDQGWTVDRLWVTNENGPVAGAQVLSQATPVGRVAYLPRGPVAAPEDPAWDTLWAGLVARTRGVAVIRLEPHWADRPETRTWLAGLGCLEVEPVQPASTVLVDLAPSEDELLADMKSKWRYNVRLAPRRDVEVTEEGEDRLGIFADLIAETAERDAFEARPPGYYADAWRALQPHAHFYVAWFEGQPLGAILVFHFGGVATYLYGASSNRERQRMPNHLLQWEAMRRAKAAGLRRYDFWGVPEALGQAWVRGEDPHDVPHGEGGLWGVWNFKRGFGGDVWRAVGAWDSVQSAWRYRLGRLGLSVRNRLRDSLAAARRLPGPDASS